MKTSNINLYQLHELSEKVKSKVFDKFRDINLDHDWWKWIYEDAEMVGLRLTSFDVDNQEIGGQLLLPESSVRRLILDNHGLSSKSYDLAKQEDLPLLEGLMKYYLAELSSYYEYIISDEGIEETIQINDYLFTEDGNLFDEKLGVNKDKTLIRWVYSNNLNNHQFELDNNEVEGYIAKTVRFMNGHTDFKVAEYLKDRVIFKDDYSDDTITIEY